MKRSSQSPFMRGPHRVSWSRLGYAGLLPFMAAVVLGSAFLRAGSNVHSGEEPLVQRHPSRATLEQTDRAVQCVGLDCGSKAGSQAGGTAAAAAALSAGSGLAPAAAGSSGSSLPDPAQLPKLFLFIGILSGRGYRHRRLAVREAWSNKAQQPGTVVSKFILSEDERTPQVEKELEAYGDIVFVREKTNYKSILYKTFYVLEYAAAHYDAAYVLKTDDDAYINVPAMVDQLRVLCENPGCHRERLYMGKMAKHSEVLLQPGHKWNNAAFHNHTGLKEYPNYMMGGGYVVGGEVARLLVDIHARMHLKFTPIEDATLGFWLMAMDLRHVDHPKFYTWAAPCCFKAPVRKPGERFVTRFQLADEFEEGLCSTDPWLVLHKIDSPTKMRYVGARVANCTPPEPWVLPASIEEYVPTATREEWAKQRDKVLKNQPKRAQAATGSRNSTPVGDSAGSSSSGARQAEAASGAAASTAASTTSAAAATAADTDAAAAGAAAGTAAGAASTGAAAAAAGAGAAASAAAAADTAAANAAGTASTAVQ